MTQNNASRDLSPVRPRMPQPSADPTPHAERVDYPVPPNEQMTEASANPHAAMKLLHQKMARITDEFASGKINRAQFEALSERYSEQQTIIQRLIERNPESSAWKQVVDVVGQTGFLRQHFEAQALYFVVYLHQRDQHILLGGKHKPDETIIQPMLHQLWSMANPPKSGLGRKAVGDTQWLILATGEYSVTAVLFSLEPSVAQVQLVRDLHADFERANVAALARSAIVAERMVVPQRALVESHA